MKAITLKPTPTANSNPIDGHNLASKFKLLIIDDLYLVSFWRRLEKPYLKGEIYCTHPYHKGMLAIFLKYPETSIRGKSMIGTKVPTYLPSFKIEPVIIPKELPVKYSSATMKYRVKNCSAVELSPIIQ